MVFTSQDMSDLKPMRAPSRLPGYKGSDYPALSIDKVRFVGEPVAVCVANTRAEAEDLAQLVEVEYEGLPPVTDMLLAKEHDFINSIRIKNKKLISQVKKNSFIFDIENDGKNSNKIFYLKTILNPKKNKKQNMADLINNIAKYFKIKKYKLYHNKKSVLKTTKDVFFLAGNESICVEKILKFINNKNSSL